MKILLAYDGSSCADLALEDMRRAGLPRLAEAVVLSVSYPTGQGLVLQRCPKSTGSQ
jgi:hypothetical protein